jgi:diaminopimelate decarboxylase
MVTRTTIARLQDRIEAVMSRLNPEPPKPRHPGIDWLRKMAMTFGATQEEAEASIAAAAREGHEHLRDHPEHPLYGRMVSEEEARAVYDAASAKFTAKLQRWLGGKGRCAT